MPTYVLPACFTKSPARAESSVEVRSPHVRPGVLPRPARLPTENHPATYGGYSTALPPRATPPTYGFGCGSRQAWLDQRVLDVPTGARSPARGERRPAALGRWRRAAKRALPRTRVERCDDKALAVRPAHAGPRRERGKDAATFIWCSPVRVPSARSAAGLLRNRQRRDKEKKTSSPRNGCPLWPVAWCRLFRPMPWASTGLARCSNLIPSRSPCAAASSKRMARTGGESTVHGTCHAAMCSATFPLHGRRRRHLTVGHGCNEGGPHQHASCAVFMRLVPWPRLGLGERRWASVTASDAVPGLVDRFEDFGIRRPPAGLPQGGPAVKLAGAGYRAELIRSVFKARPRPARRPRAFRGGWHHPAASPGTRRLHGSVAQRFCYERDRAGAAGRTRWVKRRVAAPYAAFLHWPPFIGGPGFRAQVGLRWRHVVAAGASFGHERDIVFTVGGALVRSPLLPAGDGRSRRVRGTAFGKEINSGGSPAFPVDNPSTHRPASHRVPANGDVFRPHWVRPAALAAAQAGDPVRRAVQRRCPRFSSAGAGRPTSRQVYPARAGIGTKAEVDGFESRLRRLRRRASRWSARRPYGILDQFDWWGGAIFEARSAPAEGRGFRPPTSGAARGVTVLLGASIRPPSSPGAGCLSVSDSEIRRLRPCAAAPRAARQVPPPRRVATYVRHFRQAWLTKPKCLR